jgi:DNA-binding IclR family transcriptional regulator
MARQSPAVGRAIALLNLLAETPDRSLTLTQIARALDMNKATAHTLLATLTTAQWVERDSGRGYTLGSGLVALGQSALGRDRLLHAAQSALREFADQLGYPIVLSVPVGDETMVVGVSDDGHSTHMRVGARKPISPPWGTIFAAYWGADEVDKWLDKMDPPLTEAQRQQYRGVLFAIRNHGYVIALEDSEAKLQAFLETVPANLTVGQLRSSMAHLIDLMAHGQANTLELGQDNAYRVSAITVPVLGANSRVAITMTALLKDRIEGREITRLAERMLEMAVDLVERARSPSD